MNGPWHLYACDQAYADLVVGDKLPEKRCAFGGDATRLLRAIDEICSVVTGYGLLCTTALADVRLPQAMQVNSLPLPPTVPCVHRYGTSIRRFSRSTMVVLVSAG